MDLALRDLPRMQQREMELRNDKLSGGPLGRLQ